MSKQRATTVRLLALLVGAQLALMVGLLAIELNAVHQGGNSTISEVMWDLWAKQPWVVLLVSHTIGAPFFFLMGHFFAQSRDVYDGIRRGGLVAAILVIAAPASAEPTIRGSIDSAVEKTLARAEDDQLPENDPVKLAQRVAELEARLDRVKQVADTTASCVREAFVLAGTDIVSGAAAWKFCKECGEANPLGIEKEGRLGMKLGSLGFQIERCYAAAKSGGKVSGVVKWLNRIITGGQSLLNLYQAASGKPLFRWGLVQEPGR